MASTGGARVPLLLVLPIAVAAVVTPLVLSGGRASAQPPSHLPGAAVKAIHLARCALCPRARGGELFRLQCAACHAWAGDGGALLHREAPSLHHDTPTQIGDAVRAGPGLMPAFGQAALTDNQLNDLAAYVRYLDHPDDRGGEPLWHLGPMAEGGVAVICGLGIMLLTIRWIGDKE